MDLRQLATLVANAAWGMAYAMVPEERHNDERHFSSEEGPSISFDLVEGYLDFEVERGFVVNPTPLCAGCEADVERMVVAQRLMWALAEAVQEEANRLLGR